MEDKTVIKKTFGSKMKNSVAAIPIGFLMLVIGVSVLVGNEKSVVRNNKVVNELRKNYIEISSDKVDKRNDGELVVTSGKLDYEPKSLTDEEFNINVETPLLERTVEVYQWVETKEEDDKTTYSYEKQWEEDLIDSSDFNTKENHTNPTTIEYESKTYETDTLSVGAFTLEEEFKNLLRTNKNYTDYSNVTLKEGYSINGKYITNSQDINNPQIGDVRISYKYASYKNVTVLGEQRSRTIISYRTKQRTSVNKLTSGIKSADQMIDSIEKANGIMKWIKRLIGYFLIVGGLTSILNILTTLLSYIPFFGYLLNTGVSFVASIVALAITLVIIAVAWFIFRPVLSIILILISIGSVISIKYLLKKKQELEKNDTNKKEN